MFSFLVVVYDKELLEPLFYPLPVISGITLITPDKNALVHHNFC